MDLKQLEYMVAIEKYGNMTEAAAQLFITPSALNQQLLKLEKELGIPLFTRNRRHMTPTEAGRVYLDAARKMLALRQATYAHLQDLADCQTGSFQVGLTFEHGSDLFARIYPRFHKKYPGISIQCRQMLVPELVEMLVSGQLDLAFILSGNPEIYDVEYIPLSEENLLLGIPRTHPLAYRGQHPKDPCVALDLSLLKEDSFATALKNSTMRTELIDPIFEQAGFHPQIMMESSFNAFLEQLTALGLCDTIIPQSRVTNHEEVVWFYLPGAPRFKFGAAYPKGYRLNRAISDFIEMARQDALQYMQFPPPPPKIFSSPADLDDF